MRRKTSGQGVLEYGLLVVSTLLIVSFVLFGLGPLGPLFVDDSVAIRALEAQGMTQVQVVEHMYLLVNWRGGGSGDRIGYRCEAISPAGKKVELYVFTGLFFKGATIRSF